MAEDQRSEASAEDGGPAGRAIVERRGHSPSSYPYREGGEPFTEASDADAGLDLRNILRVLIKRKWLIVAVTATFVCLGLVWALLQTPLYKATLRLQIDRSAAQIVKGADTEVLAGQQRLRHGDRAA